MHHLLKVGVRLTNRTRITSARLAAAINPITALLATFPNAVVRHVVDVTRDFGEDHDDTGSLIIRESQTGVVTRTRWDKTVWIDSGKAVFPAWPFGDAEYASLVEVRRPSDVSAVIPLVKPLASASACSW